MNSEQAELILLRDKVDAVTRERDELRAVVERLPKTADGVLATPGMKVWRNYDDGPALLYVGMSACGSDSWSMERDPSECYSTPEAALAARRAAGEEVGG